MKAVKIKNHIGVVTPDGELEPMCGLPITLNDYVSNPETEQKTWVEERQADKTLCPTCHRVASAYWAGVDIGRMMGEAVTREDEPLEDPALKGKIIMPVQSNSYH